MLPALFQGTYFLKQFKCLGSPRLQPATTSPPPSVTPARGCWQAICHTRMVTVSAVMPSLRSRFCTKKKAQMWPMSRRREAGPRRWGCSTPTPPPRTPQLPPLCLVTRILHTWSWCLWPWGHPSEEGATAPPEAASVLQAFLASGVFSRIGRREKNQEKEDRWRKRIAVTDFRVRTASTVEQCFETH